MAEGPTDKALQEFLSEAQEIVEALNRDLLALDAGRERGTFEPDVINDGFRAVHSLKGLAGLFGVQRMTALAHNLENLLDSLRLGRIELGPETLDLLFESVALFNRIIGETSEGAGGEESERAVAELTARIGKLDLSSIRPEARKESQPFGGYELDASVLSVLTEYEEHRLRENIKAARPLYRLHAAFDLMSIDQGLEQLKSKLRPVGEVITYLPSAEAANDQQIELDIILGGSVSLTEVLAAVEGLGVEVAAVPRNGAEARPASVRAPEAGPGGHALATEGASASASVGLEEPLKEVSLKSVAQTVRVDIRKLDHLMNIVGELAIARAGIQTVLEGIKADRTQQKLARALHFELRSLSRKLDEMQAGILEVRMVPLGQIFDKLSRVVRKISRDAGKEIRLHISGSDTELDKLIVEELSDPLMHVIRNSIDHGIEAPAARTAAGKPEAGTITIAAEQRGNHVVISVEDDGRGLDEQRLLESALARGAIDAAAARELTQREIYNLMFLPGISTKEVADELSGRGVGMDVVKTNIARLSGIIDVSSEPGQGTRLTITLPITLAIIQALIIRAAGRTYAIPLNSVLESLLVAVADITTIGRREVMSLRGQTLPLGRLDRMFELSRPSGSAPPQRQFVVVVGLAQHRIGLLVDELVGQQDIVIKSLGPTLAGIFGVSGATELGGKRTVLVLDVAALVEEAISVQEAAA